MLDERSFGIVPLIKKNGEWQVLLIQHGAGHWGFPKGHANENESSLMSAQRELQEETGLHIVHLFSEIGLEESYHFTRRGRPIKKSVTYFVAEVDGNLQLQVEEIKAAKWVPLTQADLHLTFPSAKSICARASQLISEINKH